MKSQEFGEWSDIDIERIVDIANGNLPSKVAVLVLFLVILF